MYFDEWLNELSEMTWALFERDIEEFYVGDTLVNYYEDGLSPKQVIARINLDFYEDGEEDEN